MVVDVGILIMATRALVFNRVIADGAVVAVVSVVVTVTGEVAAVVVKLVAVVSAFTAAVVVPD